jgi:hypothetical protein
MPTSHTILVLFSEMAILRLLLVLCGLALIRSEIENDFCKSEQWRVDLQTFRLPVAALLYPHPVMISHRFPDLRKPCGESTCRFLYANNDTSETRKSDPTAEKYEDYKYAKWSEWASRKYRLKMII